MTSGHWDAATTVLLGAKTAAQAARVWPIPEDEALARWVYPTFFPLELHEIVERWSADFAVNPKHWDRNRGRAVMLAQVDQTEAGHPMRTVVVPGLVKAGMWSREFVVQGARSAVSGDLPEYKRRWFVQLSADLGV